MYLKIREEVRVRSRSALIDIGINENGFREILGLMLGDSESETSWTELLTWLKKRHFRGLNIVVSDSHRSLVRAIRNQFQGTTWQRCQTYFMRNILDATPKSIQTEILIRVIRTLFTAPDIETTRLLLKKIIEDYSGKAPKAMEILESGFDHATAVLDLSERYRGRLRTTKRSGTAKRGDSPT